MSEIVKVEKRIVLEPTEVLPPGALPYGSGRTSPINIPNLFRTWHPIPAMRRLGYSRNPDTCRHEKKGYTPSFGWWCRDCGDSLPNR